MSERTREGATVLQVGDRMYWSVELLREAIDAADAGHQVLVQCVRIETAPDGIKTIWMRRDADSPAVRSLA